MGIQSLIMNLKFKILKLLWESKDDIFQPRRVEKRLEKLSSLEKMMLELDRGDKINVWLFYPKKFAKAILVQSPWLSNVSSEWACWITFSNNLNEDDAVIAFWDEQNNRWIRSNKN